MFDIFGKKEPPDIGEMIDEFREQGSKVASEGDLHRLKTLFADWSAKTRAADPDRALSTKRAMRKTLRETLLEPSSRVRCGWFDDL
jgi:hypothetical protein